MKLYDEYHNHIPTTIFETSLSKFILDNPRFYKQVFHKVDLAIKEFIDENSKSPTFDRLLYLLFSNFQETFPYHSFEEIMASSDVHAQTYFHKFFFETLFPKGKCLNGSSKATTLFQLAQLSIRQDQGLLEGLRKKLRPENMFSDSNRSRIEIDDDDEDNQYTQKFGIINDAYTPNNLTNFFEQPYRSAKLQFQRNRKGGFSKWLEARNLPFVSGPSGTVEIIFVNVIKLILLSRDELKSYWLGTAASMVSRGHHSFAEIGAVMSLLGYDCSDVGDRQGFYEQFLTPELVASKEYQAFLQEPEVKEYFDNYNKAFGEPIAIPGCPK